MITYCYDCSTEAHAEPGIIQSRCRLFGNEGRKPEDQNTQPNTRQENGLTNRVGNYQSINTKGTGKSQNPNEGCL